ncbi:MAG: ribulokinase [Victivallales bacterium]|nr:ribulokinase [Victivallales bacterium]
MQAGERYAIGVDYGSNSVRCLIVDCFTGHEAGVSVWNYRGGEAGVYLAAGNPHIARQCPGDFIDGLSTVVPAAIKMALETTPDFAVEKVVGIGVDFTGSTPLPLDENLEPLAFQERFKENLNAKAWMWKDHSSAEEADFITKKAREMRPQYLKKCGGTYSSEWLFSKMLHCLNVDPEVFNASYIWLEMADYIPALLCGVKNVVDLKVNICAAGHKAMYSDEWGGYPDAEFLSALAPELGEMRKRMPQKAYTADQMAGRLCGEWSAKLGLPCGLPVAVGSLDAHLGAVGAGVGNGRMVKIIGTSVCDVLLAKPDAVVPDIPGVCGIVEGSAIPGVKGIEAGQTAVGDIFNWFVGRVCGGDATLFGKLTEEASALRPGQSGLLALDWENGNRCILTDARLTGLIMGLTLQTTQAEIYRCLLEATAFGARRILDRLEEYGVEVSEVIACGGIAEKNPLFMQIYADVLGRPMLISSSAQTCALGAAMMGMVASGAYPDVTSAQTKICAFKDKIYRPVPSAKVIYDELYKLYCELHDSFGVAGTSFDHAEMMKRLLDLRNN